MLLGAGVMGGREGLTHRERWLCFSQYPTICCRWPHEAVKSIAGGRPAQCISGINIPMLGGLLSQGARPPEQGGTRGSLSCSRHGVVTGVQIKSIQGST